jgi:NAD(P)H-hydrate epimerase
MRRVKQVKQIILGQADITALLPTRSRQTHKYAAGHVLVIAGSRGMTGAALLAARAALRSGAGLVTLAVPRELADLIDVQTPEIITLPLPSSCGVLTAAALKILRPFLGNYDCILAGPGLSLRRRTKAFCRDLFQYIKNYRPGLRVVLDADALNILAGLQRGRARMRLIVTPHVGELGRMLRWSSAAVRRQPLAAAGQAALKYNAVVMLKDADKTYIVREQSRYFLNINGNPGMATAGSGDVLAGLVAGLWVSTRGMTALRAAVCAPYVHGLAGNLAARAYSVDGLIAGDILAQIPAALRLLKGA